MSATTAVSRRVFLAAGGSLALGVVFSGPSGSRAEVAEPGAPFEPNAFLRIGTDNSITLVMARVEMGQGIYTSLAMLVAEELEVPLAQIRFEHAPADPARYGNPMVGGAQITGGSNSIMGAWEPMRVAGASARLMLVEAAARTWGVAAQECLARDGQVIHVPTRQRLRYGQLAARAATLSVPTDVALKPATAFRLVGRPARRIDVAGKVNGQAVYGIDARRDGMRYAAVAACPVPGGHLKRVDTRATAAMPGVRQVVQIAHAVAVIADNTWAARQGLAALTIDWDEGPNAQVSSAQIRADLERGLERPEAGVALAQGDADALLRDAAQPITSNYQSPFLAHATLEPMNCTVDLRPEGCDVWVGTQAPARAQELAASASGLPASQIRIHNHLIGGGFGRRLEADYVEQAVALARGVRGPVQFIWSREEDIRHDIPRPAYADRMSASLDARGRPLAVSHRVVGASIIARVAPPFFRDGVDRDAVEAGLGPYEWPAAQLDYVRQEPMPGMVTGWWRGVGATHNCFVVESFMDELAAATKQDPVAYRLALLPQGGRAQAVLALAAEKAGWNQPLSPAAQAGSRRGRGVSLLFAFGSYLAQVAEVTVSASGDIRVDRVVCAVDCGMVVNPDTVEAQIDGGIQFGVGAALWGEITIQNGRVVQSNFHDYRQLRLAEAPRVEVHIVSSAEAPGGVGEPGTSAVMPAMANAVAAATGQRLRSLPLRVNPS